jgi:hypothetical protein
MPTNIPAETAYLEFSWKPVVRSDWMVETVDIELAAHNAVIETSLLQSQEREFSGQTRRAEIDLFAQNSEAETALLRKFSPRVFGISTILRVSVKRSDSARYPFDGP